MNFIENVKLFFESVGLTWNGTFYKNKQEDFVEMKQEDFDKLDIKTYMIEFSDGDSCGLVAEIDYVTFKLYGENVGVKLYSNSPNYAENLKKIKGFEDMDLSQDFIKFSLKNMGLIHATVIKKKLNEKKELINAEAKKIEKQLIRKINFINKRVEKNEQRRAEEIKQIDAVLDITENIAKTLK